uniref:Uncharacterized protein n=1 Tax=Candidatus Kentrum sp. FW TaxID=2126338 RepID=A0A450TXR6_9GAMM|nr:MAG: hypothetical protein BECKFW1821C_GA0114237_105916 [Candidatus Kentron sp. FW]
MDANLLIIKDNKIQRIRGAHPYTRTINPSRKARR